MPTEPARPILGIAGDSSIPAGSDQARTVHEVATLAFELGYRVQTGGLGDLPALVRQAADTSQHYAPGDIIGIVPGFDPTEAPVDIAIPTGLDVYRNVIVANASVVVAVGGGAGTLSEIAMAWQLNRPIFAWTGRGWSSRLAGKTLDRRRTDRVEGFDQAQQLRRPLQDLLAGGSRDWHQGITWPERPPR